MSSASPNSTFEDAGVRITLALRAEQLRLYDANLLSSVAGNLLVAALLVAVQWGSVTTERLLGWGACMGLILSARVLDWSAHRRRREQGSDGRARLLRLRLGVAGTGLIWGLAGVVLFAAQDLQHQVFLGLAHAALEGMRFARMVLAHGRCFGTSIRIDGAD